MREQGFHQLKLFRARLEVRQDFDDGAHAALVKLLARFRVERRVVPWRVEAAPVQVSEESFAERRALEAHEQARVREFVGAEVVEYAFVFQAGRELDLAELHGLKTARRVQLVAEAEKTDRRHRLKNVNLTD